MPAGAARCAHLSGTCGRCLEGGLVARTLQAVGEVRGRRLENRSEAGQEEKEGGAPPRSVFSERSRSRRSQSCEGYLDCASCRRQTPGSPRDGDGLPQLWRHPAAPGLGAQVWPSGPLSSGTLSRSSEWLRVWHGAGGLWALTTSPACCLRQPAGDEALPRERTQRVTHHPKTTVHPRTQSWASPRRVL